MFRLSSIACSPVVLILLSAIVSAQCPISPGEAVTASEWDAIFTQDGPGKGLSPAGSPGWTGGDSTYSLLLPNGDTAFFFSDSYIGEWPKAKGDGTVTRNADGLRTTEINCPPPVCDPAASTFYARNSIVRLSRDRSRMQTLVGPRHSNGLSSSYFKDPGNGLYYWLGDVIALPAKKPKRILVFLHKFDAKLAFHGSAIAELDPATLEVRKTIEVLGFPDNVIHWGSAMAVDDEHLYIYGKGGRGGKKQMFIARASASSTTEQLAASSRWKAWDGNSWIRDLAKAEPIIPNSDSISDEFNVVKLTVNGRSTYVFAGIDTTAPWGAWRDITLYSSCSPQGPFTGKHVVYSMPESNAFTVPGLGPSSKLKQHLVVYNPHIHPQFTRDGRLLISYNINRSSNEDTIYIDGYRPRFIYVPIEGLK